MLEIHDRIVREALAAHAGREVKHTGDGIMASFVSAAATVKAAARIQAELSKSQIRARIGAAAGEPVERSQDLFGSPVQLAARLCAHAEPEQILVSNVVVELCLGKRITFFDLGEVTLKGFEAPVRVHKVDWPSPS